MTRRREPFFPPGFVLLAMVLLPIVAVLAVSAWRARADEPIVHVQRLTTNQGHDFTVSVDGPVVVRIAVYPRSLTAAGDCVVDHLDSEYVYAVIGATCTGPGALAGQTQVYDYWQCVDGVYTADNMVVAADGVIVSDDRARGGACSDPTTTAPSTTAARTTTVAPSTTVATRVCTLYVSKPFRHCIRWSPVP